MINIDIEKVEKQSQEVNSKLEYYEKFGSPLVNEYCKDLDEKVTAIKKYLTNIRQYNLEFDVPSLQKIVIDLSTTIYYTTEKYEKMSLLADMAKVSYKDKYNEAYLAHQEAATVDKRKFTSEQLRSMADQEAIEEELIHFIYDHAAAAIKSRLDSAQEVLKGCSKSLSAQIQSMQSFGIAQKHM